MDVGGGVQPDAGVAVAVVVPLDELGHERPGLTDGFEAFGEHGREFEGLEPALAGDGDSSGDAEPSL